MQDRRLEMRVDEAFFAVVDAWRREQADLPTRPEAIRRMVLATAERDRKSPPKRAPAPKPTKTAKRSVGFDKTAYQREYMRKRRAAKAAERLK